MTDRPKAKPLKSKTFNDARANRKAAKKATGSHSRSVRLSSLEKVLLGKGAYLTFNGVGSDPRTQTSGNRA